MEPTNSTPEEELMKSFTLLWESLSESLVVSWISPDLMWSLVEQTPPP